MYCRVREVLAYRTDALGVLQCVAVCHSVLHCVAMYFIVREVLAYRTDALGVLHTNTPASCNVLTCVAVHERRTDVTAQKLQVCCSVLQGVAVTLQMSCSALQVYCSVLYCDAVCGSA